MHHFYFYYVRMSFGERTCIFCLTEKKKMKKKYRVRFGALFHFTRSLLSSFSSFFVTLPPAPFLSPRFHCPIANRLCPFSSRLYITRTIMGAANIEQDMLDLKKSLQDAQSKGSTTVRQQTSHSPDKQGALWRFAKCPSLSSSPLMRGPLLLPILIICPLSCLWWY